MKGFTLTAIRHWAHANDETPENNDRSDGIGLGWRVDHAAARGEAARHLEEALATLATIWQHLEETS